MAIKMRFSWKIAKVENSSFYTGSVPSLGLSFPSGDPLPLGAKTYPRGISKRRHCGHQTDTIGGKNPRN